MRTPMQQLDGLEKLAKFIVDQYECNIVIRPAGSNVAFLQALDTPSASQIVYASEGYDVWVAGHLQKPDLSIEQAAEVVISEYFLAKAARIKQIDSKASIDEVMASLRKGYQRRKAQRLVF